MAMRSDAWISLDGQQEKTSSCNQHGSPQRGRPHGQAAKARGRGRSPRSACNFCHDKRVKCVMTEGESRCEQCIQRDTDCIFSIKGKTGPKPKSAKPKTDSPRQRSKSSRRSRRPSHLIAEASTLPKHEEGSEEKYDVNLSAPAVVAGTAEADRECTFLQTYLRTIGKLVPLVKEELLIDAIRERTQLPQGMVATAIPPRTAHEQAEVVGVLSLGALIHGNVEAAESYHFSLRYHVGDVLRLTDPKNAPALALVALYWQHRGEEELKAEWVGHARGMLGHSNEIPVDLILSIEHLDYAREAHVRPGIDTLPPSRRALHCVSRLLSNMPTIVNPSVGRATAVAFCDELSVCIRGLRTETSMELSLLLCTSLRALLLILLGRRDAALSVLDSVPGLLNSASGGNKWMVRALPLSWDALLIASSLSFMVGQDDNYRLLRAAVAAATDVPSAARWTFCLPEPGSDPCGYVSHECNSSSNICTIMCEIASTTGFGQTPFYPDVHSVLHPPAVALPPEPGHEQNDILCDSDEHGALAAMNLTQVYGAGGAAMQRALLGEDWAGADTEPPFKSPAPMDVNSGGCDAVIIDDELEAALTPTSAKRRRLIMSLDAAGSPKAAASVLPGAGEGRDISPPSPATVSVGPASGVAFADGTATVDHTGSIDATTGTGRVFFPTEVEGRRAGERILPVRSVEDDDVDDDDGLGLSRGLHNMSLSRLTGGLLPVGADNGASGGVAPVSVHQGDRGPLGRVPSEGILDLGSTLGSFSMDIGAATTGADGGIGGAGGGGLGEDDGTGGMIGMIGGRRRSQRKMGSFSTYSTVLCRSWSNLHEGGAKGGEGYGNGGGGRGGGGNGRGGGTGGCGSNGDAGSGNESIDQCSDLGQDIVVAGENFMNEEGNDECIYRNIMNVDGMLDPACGNDCTGSDIDKKTGGWGTAPMTPAGTGAEGGGKLSGDTNACHFNSETSPGFGGEHQKSMMSRALADLHESNGCSPPPLSSPMAGFGASTMGAGGIHGGGTS